MPHEAEPNPIKSSEPHREPVNVPLVRDDDPSRVLPRHAGGRPLKLTVAKFLRICAWIQQGQTNTRSCQLENVDYSGFRAHVRTKPRWTKRYEHANSVRDEFLCDLHLSNVARHAERNWQASAWILERKFPTSFALHFSNRDTATKNAAIGDAVSEDQLRRYSQLMSEFATERQAASTKTEPATIEDVKQAGNE